jgi:hypothetical protein
MDQDKQPLLQSAGLGQGFGDAGSEHGPHFGHRDGFIGDRDGRIGERDGRIGDRDGFGGGGHDGGSHGHPSDAGHVPSSFGSLFGGDDGHGLFGGHGGAGGDLDAILFGHLDASGLHAGFGPGSVVVIPIEHLDINQNTLIQNTNILFDAHGGGSVSVGGDVTAISSQTGLIDHVPDAHAIAA